MSPHWGITFSMYMLYYTLSDVGMIADNDLPVTPGGDLSIVVPTCLFL